MDIYILREGKEIGPFSNGTTQTLLSQGSVFLTDLAWRPGMPEWIPLEALLSAEVSEDETAEPKPLPPAAAPAIPPPLTPATAKQVAFLRFMEIPFTEELSKEQAAVMINDVMENPKDAARVARWNEERLSLHADLFAAEIEAKKENRPAEFLQIVQTEGASFFTKVTKAHCMVVVGHLDLRFPQWDAKPKEAVWNYFFPGIAEKFPQLVNKSAVGRFKYPDQGDARKPSSKPLAKRSAPASKPPVAPMAAAMRGLMIGALILGILFAGNEYRKRQAAAALQNSQQPVAAGDIPEPPPELPKPIAKKTAPAVQPVPAVAASEPTMAEDPAMPETPELPPAPVEPLPVQPKTIVTITQPVTVKTPFGSVVIRPGTQARIVSRDDATVSVRYFNDTVSVPVASTDLGASAVAPSVPALPPATAPATPAPAKPPATSLF